MSDEELAAKAAGGDMTAFDELVVRYQSRMMGIAFGMLSDHSDACDAVQEIFFRMYKGLSSFRNDAAFSTWLYRIAANVCRDMLRSRAAHETESLDKTREDGTAVYDMPDTADSPHETAERREKCDAVRDAVSRLPDDYREVITMRELQGMPYDKIADVIGCPIGTVRSRLNRAKSLLRETLSKLKY